MKFVINSLKNILTFLWLLIWGVGIQEIKIELVFIKEQHINTNTYKKALRKNIELTGTNVDFILEGVNKYLLALAKEQIIIAFNQAENEVTDLQQRT